MTAVEFISKRLFNILQEAEDNDIFEVGTQNFKRYIEMFLEEAKEMEKQQIIDSHLNGQSEFDKGKFRTEVIKNAEQYYKETFKNK